MQQDLSKTFYNNQKESVNIITRFSSKKSFLDPPIFINRKDLIMKQWLSKMQNKLKFN